jgi:hypothetical protein
MSDPKTDDEPKIILVNKLNPMSEYIPFGKYLLSLKQLQKNRFMLRTKSRNPVLSFKTIVLTRRTKAIVQKLLQDLDVSFDEIDSLTEDEKNDIDTIISKTDINTRLRVPNTRRSKLEKDLNKFNVLRGSIIAGNDSTELLKDFRRLLLHLTTENYISKKESNEVLMEMLKLNI